MPAKKKYETTHNKRAGIFYGPATGHPIIWNNDWNSLIQKEVLARDNFSRNFVAGKISAPVPVYKDISINEANWNYLLKSTYMDLGKWGSSTFRQSVPHVVGKKEAENPSVPPTGAPSEVMSEYAYRHVRSVCVCEGMFMCAHVRAIARSCSLVCVTVPAGPALACGGPLPLTDPPLYTLSAGKIPIRKTFAGTI
jgi:hypothetical protein